MLDDRDLKILDILQRDSDTPVHKVAEQVALSPSACSRRIAHLREAGYIRGTMALLDRDKLAVPMTVYVILHAPHSENWLDRFSAALASIPEIVECHRLAGNFDYLMKVVVANVAQYDSVYRTLISAIDLNDVSAYISMETIKDEPFLPISPRLAGN